MREFFFLALMIFTAPLVSLLILSKSKNGKLSSEIKLVPSCIFKYIITSFLCERCLVQKNPRKLFEIRGKLGLDGDHVLVWHLIGPGQACWWKWVWGSISWRLAVWVARGQLARFHGKKERQRTVGCGLVEAGLNFYVVVFFEILLFERRWQIIHTLLATHLLSGLL